MLAAFAAFAAFALSSTVAMSQVPALNSDGLGWTEEIEGKQALDWARAENTRSLAVLQGDARYADFRQKALDILTAKDRIPPAGFAADGSLRGFWQDADHVRGLWRTTTMASYRTAAPQWRTLIDLDALSKAENANWVWKGTDCLQPDGKRCLVYLSDGGKDAVTIREFDVAAGGFVKDGFVSPSSKQNVEWETADALLIGRDWGPGTLTASGYSMIIKRWKRGQPLDQAIEVFRGKPEDVSVQPIVLRDNRGVAQASIILRGVSFFESEFYLLGAAAPVKLPLPLRSSLKGLIDGQMVFSLEQDWPEQNLKSGDLAAYDLAALKAAPASAKPTLILRPTARQSVEGTAISHGKLAVSLYDNVRGALRVYSHGPGGWTFQTPALPADSSVDLVSASDDDDRLLVSVTGYLAPTTLWLVDGASLKAEAIKALPPRFDASTHVVEQFEATSKDGTRIPYFVVRPKGVKYDGSAPTLLYAYGGFQISMTPAYSGAMGKLWLERGGTYVVANIRGGGEFGPNWHEAALKADRQKAYDDFFAVSEDLIARKITSPRRLGIMGGSNGGLLMGVALTQRPDLYNAIVVQVPLFDMLRYTQIGAGASWAGEYGDPAIPAERAVIERYSPLQNLKAGQKYPEVFIETSTKDDRVHPSHARKAGARLKALGYPYFYYENIDGGHAGAANLNETAMRYALEYVYLSRKLMD
ncbi:MAG: S9 family peptidase [Caulobacterales bacterium]|nr:S9 family peptidase [Caulobacterales bacterium]